MAIVNARAKVGEHRRDADQHRHLPLARRTEGLRDERRDRAGDRRQEHEHRQERECGVARSRTHQRALTIMKARSATDPTTIPSAYCLTNPVWTFRNPDAAPLTATATPTTAPSITLRSNSAAALATTTLGRAMSRSYA